MPFCCYIIYSRALGKYYIGETVSFEERLVQHNSGFFKNAYTSKSNDWEEYLIISCESRKEARNVEHFIKNMKSRKFIEKLKGNDKLIKAIVEKANKQ